MNNSYEKALKKSTNKKVIKILGKNYVLNVERHKQFRKKMLAIILSAAFAVTTYAMRDHIRFELKRNNLKLNVVEQMLEVGYQTFPNPDTEQWDYNYELLDGIDIFELMHYVGTSTSEQILQYRGYENWDDYAQKMGYENKHEWYHNKKIDYVKKARSK